jgi:phospholipase D1/2
MEEPGSDPQLIYLHGDLDLKIIEAKDLPNMDLVAQHFRRCFTACDTISPCHTSTESDARGHHHRKIITSDPYVTVSVPQATVARTRVIKNSSDPQWNEQFYIPLAHPVNTLKFQVKDDDIFGSELIGTVEIPARDIVSGDLISDWFPLNGSFKKHKPEIRIEMKFTPFEENPAYKHGIASDPEHRGVRHTYFPLRKGGSLRLYQDAHVPDGFLPKIELDRGKVYEQEKCWEDICYAISEAHHLIYIVGWSVFHKVKLVRERSRSLPRGGDLTLGELLKYKSEEGVRVLLLVWDDKTSHDKFFINTVRFAHKFSDLHC